MMARPGFVSARSPLGILRAHSVQEERNSVHGWLFAAAITRGVSLSRSGRHKVNCYGNRANRGGLFGSQGPVKHS